MPGEIENECNLIKSFELIYTFVSDIRCPIAPARNAKMNKA